MSQTTAATAPTTHAKLLDWVGEIAELTTPDAIHWCDGSAEEYDSLAQGLVDAGTFERLSDAKRPNSYLARSDPDDVARVEDRTFICSSDEDDAGPTNNWAPPAEMRATLAGPVRRLHARPHDVRDPVLDGPARLADRPDRRPDHRLAPTSSLNMRIMTRMGKAVLDVLGSDGEFVPCVHSVGAPLDPGPEGRAVAVRTPTSTQVHRPLPRDPRDLVLRLRLRRQRAARQEVLRAAHRLGRWPATRAGWPSTC